MAVAAATAQPASATAVGREVSAVDRLYAPLRSGLSGSDAENGVPGGATCTCHTHVIVLYCLAQYELADSGG